MAKLSSQQSEVKKLKAENARLKKAVSESSKKKTVDYKKYGGISIGRTIVIGLLVTLSAILLTAGNIFFWTGNTVVKQDRFVAATSPIVKDPVVQKTAASYTTNKIFEQVDVQSYVQQVLPPKADFLAPQLTNQLKNYTQTTLQKIYASPKFQDRWNKTMARQHERLITFAANYKGDDTISVNDIYNQAVSNLQDTKLAFLSDKKLPAHIGEITVVSAPWLPKFHNLVTHIDQWRLYTALLVVVFLALAIWLSRNRHRTVYWFSSVTVLLMLVTLLVLHTARDRILGTVDPQYQAGVQHIIQTVFHSLVLQTVTILAAAVVVGLVSWVSGSNRGAVAVRRQVGLIFGGKLHQSVFGESSNKFSDWVLKNKRLLEWLAVAILAAVMLLVRLTIKSLVIYLIILVLLVLSIEFIAGQKDH